MNIFKFLRKPYLASFLSFIIIATACTQYDSEVVEQENSIDYSLYHAYQNSNVVLNNPTVGQEVDAKRAPENAWVAYIDEVNATLGTDLSLPREATSLINKDAETILAVGEDNGWIKRADVKNTYSFISDTEKYGFDTALANYESAVLASHPSPDELERQSTIISILKSQNEANPYLYNFDGERTSKLWGCSWCKCAAASVALVVATANLANCVTVVACGLAIVLVYAASNGFAAACLEE